MRTPRFVKTALIVLALGASACAEDRPDAASSGAATSGAPAEVISTTPASTDVAGGPSTASTPATSTTTTASTTASATQATAVALATFSVQPGVNQLAVLDAIPGAKLELVANDGAVTAKGTVDSQGSFLWRQLKAGAYAVRTVGTDATASKPAEVYGEEKVPPASFYSGQTGLPASGFGYITMRDGTTLSADVLLPGPADKGPYPTIVEYSGYQPSDPGSTTFGKLFNALGYAYVGVNMRGTGCSGGSYLFFERAQSIDGYDVIEAVASQPWVLHHKVGMGGISYPGISQLFVASTTPPSLAAITPLSVIDDSYRGNGYPGGILNTGFAAQFVQERFDEAKPYGQAWSKKRADAGDKICADNQKLRLQNPDFLALTKANPYYVPATADILSPATFVGKIKVPVFIAGAWQDEQTGGRFPDMLAKFTGSPHLYADLTNGLHTESLSPTIFARMVEFLDLYVANKTPSLTGARAVANVLVPGLYGVNDVKLPDDRFTGMSYTDSLAKFEAEPPIRVLFEEGTGGAEPGAPYPRFAQSFAKWPIPQAVATSWYLADKGVLAPAQQTTGTADSYKADPSALPAAFYPGGRSSNIWKAGTVYDWRPLPSGTGVGYASEPIKQDTVIIGSGSVDLWIKSSTPDTDLELTISEVRPDGTEMYIQSGWLRASHRALDTLASTDVLPVQTHAESDAAPLPAGEFTPVRIELFPFAYAFRAGSRIRITVDAPGNSRPVWEFDTIDKGETVTIAHDAGHPSKVVLQVVPGVTVPPGAAACGALKGQPCRTYVPADNESGLR